MAGISDLFILVATVDRLLKLEAKQAAAIDEIKFRPLDPDRRVTRLEAREEIVIAEAKAAAGAAACQVTMMAIADMARRIGGLEAQGPAQRPRRYSCPNTAPKRPVEPTPKRRAYHAPTTVRAVTI